MNKWDVARALKASDLPAPAKLIMWDLLDSADADTAVISGQFTPSLTDLARTTGLGRSTVARELNRLERAGWVLRDRPDPVKARTEFARTGYGLAVPPSPAVGLGSGPSPAPGLPQTPSPAPGLDLVPERDGPRPTAGHIPSPHHPDLDPSTEDDQILSNEAEDKELAVVTEEIRLRLDTTVDRPWATKVRDRILEGRTVQKRHRTAYLRKTIRNEPDPRGRFLPSRHETPAAVDATPWCGACKEATRQVEDEHGRPKRCQCHPLYGQPLARRS